VKVGQGNICKIDIPKKILKDSKGTEQNSGTAGIQGKEPQGLGSKSPNSSL
jgi:hypothetical protein